MIELDGHAAVEVGLVTQAPLASVEIEPFLALNRRSIPLAVRWSNPEEARGRRALLGSRPSQWRPKRVEGIVVDDLDAGFSVAEREDGTTAWWEAPGRWLDSDAGWTGLGTPLDQELPRFGLAAGFSGAWTRDELASAWGKYRRTVARAATAGGKDLVIFEAGLPERGLWHLEYHMPDLRTAGRRWGSRDRFVSTNLWPTQGSYEFRLDAGSERRDVLFDGAGATPGWNPIGSWNLGPGKVRLAVSNRTSGEMVFADAIRWRVQQETSAQ